LFVDGSLKGLRSALNFATGPESAFGVSSDDDGCAAAAELATTLMLLLGLDTSGVQREVNAGGLWQPGTDARI